MKRLGGYEDLQSVLEDNDANMSASETHGLAAGMLCVQFDADFIRWVTAVFDTDEQIEAIEDDSRQVLMGLFEGTRELLEADEFIFDLLLPDDDERISVRASGLSEWCQGFLYGVAYMGVGDDKDWAEESRGILRDLMEISRLDSDNTSDTDEQAFMELHEYVRMGVQMLLQELQPSDEEGDGEPTLH
ncbi:MAG: hypothetical protein A6F70_00805 [Cycloclasticus sp. symbiont of Bathymodiolus heckerae]|nr:MAG: hypothetical protein A6F70_00805 [Cycloclasticus sp. symbiont of Bathymodiolus heckerae]